MFDRKAYMKIYHKRWYESNKTAITSRQEAYNKKHRDELLKYKQDWYQKNKERCKRNYTLRYPIIKDSVRRTYNLKILYGITPDYYNKLLKAQKFACAICGKRKSGDRRLDVDHCHKTKRVRGLLCSGCNRGLGYFHDNPSLFDNAKRYLQRNMHENYI